MHLHEEVGPRETTISAIAERAGVQRLTVYRHFSDETAVFQACTSHWLSLNPPPDPTAWASIKQGAERFKAATGAVYEYYGRTRKMWSAAHRDVAVVPALQAPMAQFSGFLAAIGQTLAGAFVPAPSRQRNVAIQHALKFQTWADLEAEGLSDAEKVDLVARWVGASK